MNIFDGAEVQALSCREDDDQFGFTHLCFSMFSMRSSALEIAPLF
jgi:hypothetical protein